MKYTRLLCLFFLQALSNTISLLNANLTPHTPLAIYSAPWLVIGAGPAGISAVAALRDANIAPEKIIWVDPLFSVGALGKSYRNVPPNSSHRAFFNFFNNSNTLRRHSLLFRKAPIKNDSRTLAEVVDPLQNITDHLRNEVASIKDRVDKLTYNNEKKLWVAALPGIMLHARNVIFAIGATPTQLPHLEHQDKIPLNIALDAKKLKNRLKLHRKIAVFGSSHSAALALKNLIEAGCTNIVHVYKNKFRFYKQTPGGELYPFSGLKGPVGIWAKKNLPHKHIKALHIDSPDTTQAVAQCTATIDAVGFTPAPIPVDPQYLFQNRPSPHELGPRLYGIGIAFPSIQKDIQNNEEFAVGLVSFMKTLKKNLPAWIATDKKLE